MNYRREIDGLRAVAVVPVILFHAGFGVFSGGYAGVDVFFVISGYLITSILINELEQGKFSILRFYERRARRILPALFVVMLACLPFAYMWMLPSQLEDFAQSLVAVVFFGSNILFWRESGYFGAAAELKPLLHTWSLAVEEQYYLIFPIFLLLAWRFGRNKVFWSVVAIAAFSLLLSEWGWRNSPSANFYLAPTRAWELLAGSMCAFLTVGQKQRSSNLLSALGLALIVFAIFYYDENTPFPSAYALAPVAGTALIILFADKTTWTARLLSTRGFVGIGLVSYSAYLWHQPLFAFARIRSLTEPSHYLMAVLAVAALLLAWATWRWVEQPFRKCKKPLLGTQKRLFWSSGAVGAVFVILGLAGHLGKGLEWRLDDSVLSALSVQLGDTSGCHNALDAADIRNGKTCKIGSTAVSPSIAIIGDSHAARITDALSEQLLAAKASGITFNGSWCAPLRNFATNTPGKDGCLGEINAALDQVVSQPEIRTVILFAQWSNYTAGLRWPETVASTYVYAEHGDLNFLAANPQQNALFFEEALRSTVGELNSAGKSVLIVLPTPEFEFHVPNLLARVELFGASAEAFDLEIEDYNDRSIDVRDILYNVGNDLHVKFLDPKTVYCDTVSCSSLTAEGSALYEDSNHLSYLGSVPLADEIMDIIRD
jgi:peptidoglycan/LPS O-acetylase OafA/YrhL